MRRTYPKTLLGNGCSDFGLCLSGERRAYSQEYVSRAPQRHEAKAAHPFLKGGFGASSKANNIPAGIDPGRMPRHIAIIMDGNGRWAKARGLSRVHGHRQGVVSVEEITKACARWGVEVLTLYTFSTENWSRSKFEVNALMSLLCRTLRSKEYMLADNNVRLKISGMREGLSKSVQKQLDETVSALSKNTGLTLNLAFNYGSRQEIIDAVNAIIKDGRRVDEKSFEEYLYTRGLPDPDLVIRTSGEMRISNFLLWQSAYSEFYFTETLWPDFREKDLALAVQDFQKRQRRFGG